MKFLYSFLLVVLLSPQLALAAPADAVNVFDDTTTQQAIFGNYVGGSIINGPDIYNMCVDMISGIKQAKYDYYITLNGKEFKSSRYSVLDTPYFDSQQNKKTFGYYYVVFYTDQNKKSESEHLTMNCTEDNNGVNFIYVGELYGDKLGSNSEQSIFVSALDTKLKKIVSKGNFTQTGGSGQWGGYTYTTPWKASYATLDKKLVRINEHVASENRIYVSDYDGGSFANYTKCVKSQKSFCMKKSGKKLVLFSRVGWGSKQIDFLVK